MSMQPPPPPQDGNPFGQQQPPAQGQPGMPPQGPPPPEQPSKGGKAKKYLRFGIPLVILAIAVGSYFFNKSDAEKVSAGDCVSIQGISDVDLEQVDCDADEATHKVLKKVEGETSATACTGVEGTTQQVYTKESRTDFSLCLGPAKD